MSRLLTSNQRRFPASAVAEEHLERDAEAIAEKLAELVAEHGVPNSFGPSEVAGCGLGRRSPMSAMRVGFVARSGWAMGKINRWVPFTVAYEQRRFVCAPREASK